jgi:hypothetical protein
VLFVDEVRANTSQKQYGNIGGRKFFATRGTCPQEKKAYSDCQFTVLGFTIVNGVPIMCALIIAAKKTTVLPLKQAVSITLVRISWSQEH